MKQALSYQRTCGVSIHDIVGELFSVRSLPEIWQKRSARKSRKQGEKLAVQLLAGELPAEAGEMSEAEAFPSHGACLPSITGAYGLRDCALHPGSNGGALPQHRRFLAAISLVEILGACFIWVQHHNVCCRRGTVCMKRGTNTKIWLCCWTIEITTGGRAISRGVQVIHW